MHLESFEHEQNIPASHKNVPEYLEYTQNSVRMFGMHFDYQGMYHEFSFRLISAHSGPRVTRVLAYDKMINSHLFSQFYA